MKLIFYLFKDFFVKAVKEKRIIFIICFSLSITIAISLILIKGLLLQIGDVQEINESKRSYFVDNQCNTEDSRCALTLDKILADDSLPAVTDCSDVFLSSLSSDINVLTVTSYNTDRIGNMCEILSGNQFTENDLVNGNMNVICDENYLKEHYPNYSVGDNITLFRESFTIIGIFSSSNDSFADCYVPYNTIVKLCNNGNNDISVSSTLSIDFAEELTLEQKNKLINIANMYTHQTDEVNSRYDLTFSGKVLDCILYIGLIVIMFAFCITNVINLFKYFSVSNLYEYSILKICGSNNGFITILMFLQSMIIVIFSYILGLAEYFISIPLQELLGLNKELSMVYYLIVFLFVVVAITFSYIPTIKKISTVSPVDKRLWR